MVFDGFYPHYFSQKKQILFIGWEAYELESCNYIHHQYQYYRGILPGMTKNLNRDRFHRLMIYIAYGIVNGNLAWDDIPKATEIGKQFATGNGLSFAFMNVSKLSNESERTTADWNLINKSYRLSTEGRNFIKEQLAIIEPHIIITMDLIDKFPGLFDNLETINPSEHANSYWLDLKGHRSLVIDAWHFSKRGMKSLEDYYSDLQCNTAERGCRVIASFASATREYRIRPGVVSGKLPRHFGVVWL